jgi:V/A-type H+-transporting ATPase subunit I
MIASMEKLFLVGPRRLAPEILLALQHAEVVQIDTLRSDEIGEYRLSREEETRLRGWDGVVLSTDHSLRLLGLEADPSVEAFPGELGEAERTVSALERHAAAAVEKRDQLKDELDLIDQYHEVVTALAETAQGLDESQWLTVLPFLLDKREDLPPLEKELTSILDGRFLLSERSLHGGLAVALVVLKREVEEARGVLSRRGLSELPRKGEYAALNLEAAASLLKNRLRVVPEELARTEENLHRLAMETGRTLKGVWNRAKNESVRLHILREMVSGRYGFALFGWVPVRLEGRVRDAMNGFDRRILFSFDPVEDREAPKVPVMLENPGWVKPFESLISFLNTPRYDGWDPTWVVALFFPLWFGMIVGDIGYALIFAAACWYLRRYVKRRQPLVVDFFKLRIAPEGVARIVAVLAPMIGWTVVWGFLYGEFFGDLLQRCGIFTTPREPGLIPILILRTDTLATSNTLILVSIGFGVYQVLYGFYLKAWRTRRRGERKQFWEAVAYFSGVAALVLFSYGFMSGNFRLGLLVLVAVGASVFLAGVIKTGMPLMIAELPTQGGHILSYIRIYAVGLASAILANLSTNIGFTLYHLLGFAGLLVGILVGVLTSFLIHAVLVLLLTVSHVLQPIRLIWVEFFTKFDFYTVSGRPYRPFRSIGSREITDC